MKNKIVFVGSRAILTTFALMVFVTTTCTGAERVVHNFGNGSRDGRTPLASLIFDASGNLYGTTNEGGTGVEHCNTGTGGCGTVFELTPKGEGSWTEKVLHSFTAVGKDGNYPVGNLIFDASGNLYGTTSAGGAHVFYGTVFELTPKGDGSWTEKILHSFNYGANDGSMPQAGLIPDAAGNLYGTTLLGGEFGYGTVFELTPTRGGKWKEKLLYSFDGEDGYSPMGNLTFDATGNLYGTTYYGADQSCGYGGYGCGVVFELTPKTGGGWTESVLHRFSGNDGESPSTTLIFDASGNLYGTTPLGGDNSCGNGYGCGTVFELTPKGNGSWTETVLRVFDGEGKDGYYPEASLIFDASGNLYSTTYEGGALSCYYGYGCGTVFELTPTADGGWTEKILHTFDDNGKDGSGPVAGLIFDTSGKLYSTTIRGGDQSCGDNDGCGTVFEITP